MTAELAVDAFRRRFGAEPMVVASAPGRVNLIGEHTDYNEGFVLPMPVPMRAWVAMSARADRHSVVHSLELGEVELSDLDCEPVSRGAWHDPARGMLCGLAAHANLTVSSEVPRGAGLSSSAAVTIAIARAWHGLHGVDWNPADMARLARHAENEFAGVQSGIMDQLAAASPGGAALLIDCRDLAVRHVAIADDISVVVMDTGVRRSLADSEYNARRGACARAVERLRRSHPEVRSLRDVTPGMLETDAGQLTAEELRRARHVVTENGRVHSFVAALARGDHSSAGALLDASHRSLRDDFDVSSAQLDIICELAREHPACFGARLTGAGFGGCAIALVGADGVDAFIAQVQPRYEAATYKQSAFFTVRPAPGARIDARTGTPVPPAAG